jgi:hypothetical protein
MVANSSHRIEEPPLETPNSTTQRASLEESSVVSIPDMVDGGQTEVLSSAADVNPFQIVEPAQTYSEEEGVEYAKSTLPSEDVEVEYVERTLSSEGEEVEHVEPVLSSEEEVEYVKPVLSPEVVVLAPEDNTPAEGIKVEPLESISTLSSTDVVVIDRSDDFLNLNLIETDPLSMVLVEGDQLILDDVNEGLSEFQSITGKDLDETVIEPEVVETSDIASEEIDQEQQLVVSIVVPDVDQELMQGTDKISLEYQASMAKLLEVKQQMAEADVENEKLKEKFSSVVNQNRELAILIRDIDMKIKTLTASN